MAKPHVFIISPALANANNGNWQTAYRWAKFLSHGYEVSIVASAAAALPATAPHAVIALHARRSALALAQFCTAFPALPTILVLTGTDLYRDIQDDRAAQHSLHLATRLVLLQEAGMQELTPALREKASVIHQSAPSLTPKIRSARPRHFDVTMIGHLREEKDPATYLRAVAHISLPQIRMTHVGAALDSALGAMAAQTAAAQARYRWLGDLPHARARQHLKRSDLMVISSRMEGGANVIIEAVTSGVPVLASDISGNRGMLGDTYAGYFPPGDADALARLIERAASDADFYALLKTQCSDRARLFSVETEKAAVLQLVDNCAHLKRGTP
jgi:putative glycosyltransferase (TIGR04348 family)